MNPSTIKKLVISFAIVILLSVSSLYVWNLYQEGARKEMRVSTSMQGTLKDINAAVDSFIDKTPFEANDKLNNILVKGIEGEYQSTIYKAPTEQKLFKDIIATDNKIANTTENYFLFTNFVIENNEDFIKAKNALIEDYKSYTEWKNELNGFNKFIVNQILKFPSNNLKIVVDNKEIKGEEAEAFITNYLK